MSCWIPWTGYEPTSKPVKRLSYQRSRLLKILWNSEFDGNWGVRSETELADSSASVSAIIHPARKRETPHRPESQQNSIKAAPMQILDVNVMHETEIMIMKRTMES